MKVAVIGASRGIGRQVVMAALENGHTVTAFSRHPEALNLKHPRLKFQVGDVLDAASAGIAVGNQDAVVCALGLPALQAIGPPFAKQSYVLSAGTANILKAMKAAGVKRFVCVTAIGSGDSITQCTPPTRLVLRRGLRWLFQEKDRQEKLIKDSDLQWTIVRPTALTNGKHMGAVMDDRVRSGLLTHISRADVAAWIIENIGKPATYKKAIAISYPPRFGDSVRWIIGYKGTFTSP